MLLKHCVLTCQGTTIKVFGQSEPKMLPGGEVLLVPVLIFLEADEGVGAKSAMLWIHECMVQVLVGLIQSLLQTLPRHTSALCSKFAVNGNGTNI